MSEKFYITTAIDYLNAKPHIGHAYEKILADVVARYYRETIGAENVFFLTGADEHGTKIEQAAIKAGKLPKEFADEIVVEFKRMKELCNLSWDRFIRTTDEDHIATVQELWKRCDANGDIYKKKYQGMYCVGCEVFKKESDLIDGKCPDHNCEPEIVEEENYFFKLSKYKDAIKQKINSGELAFYPSNKKTEILNILDDIDDFSISRPVEKNSWGIVVPNDPTQNIYVWFDALTNYITALDYANKGEKFKEYWEGAEEIIHIIGKGINRFHTIYWPAVLLSAGERMPNKVFAHGYVTAGGQKMSKSLGNVIDPFSLIEKYGAEAVRYYLLREIPAYEDGDFSIEKFEARYNGDLANGLGNFASRVLKLYSEYGGEETEALVDLEKVEEIKEKIGEFKFNEAIALIFEMITVGDKYFNEKKPWETKDESIIGDTVGLLKKVAELLIPFLPGTAEKILGKIKNKEAIKEPLFPRLEKFK